MSHPNRDDGSWPYERGPYPPPEPMEQQPPDGRPQQQASGGGAVFQRPAAVPVPREPGQTTSGRASVPAVGPVSAPVAPFSQQQATGYAEPEARGLTAPPLTSAPLARPGSHVPERPPPGPPTDPEDDDGSSELTGPSGRTGRLRIGWHVVSRAGLRRVTVAPPAPAGLILGRDQRQVPVPLRIFAPGPVRVALVGGVWAAQLVIFRAFSAGVRVVVVTTEPRAWAGFGERATGQQNRLTVVAAEPPGEPSGGTAQTPLLTVFDLGVTGPTTGPPMGSWHSRLTVLRQLDRPGMATLQEAGLTILQRLGGDEATLAVSALKLRPQSSRLLQSMNDDMLALIGDGDDRYLFLNQTGIEQQYLGHPRR